MKSYTNLEQSEKLAGILPLESADMYYSHEFVNSAGDYYKLNFASEGYFDDEELLGSDIPCWSLSGLLSVLPNGTDIVKEEADTEKEKYMCTVEIKDDIISTFGNNPVDACYLMLIKLNELKQL